MVSFNEQAAAIRVRDAVNKIAQRLLDDVRPGNLYGQVVSIDHVAGTCKVVFPGAAEPTQVDMGVIARPHDATLGVQDAFGSIVEISGTPGRYRVIDILFGMAHPYGVVLDNFSIGTGYEKHATVFSMWVNEPSIAGNQMHIGRFENPGSVLGAGLHSAKMVVQQVGSNIVKEYEFSIVISTGGFWRPLPEWFSTGPNGMDYSVEIKADSTGFDLRIRRLFGLSGGSYRVTLWLFGADYVFNSASALGETSDAAAVMDPSTTYVASDRDGPVRSYPFYNAIQHTYQHRISSQLQSGGSVTWNGTRLNWDGTFVALVGLGWHNTSGMINITAPVNNQSIQVHGSTSATTSTVTTAGIDMQVEINTALYYEPLLGGDGTSSSGRFHLVCSSEEFTIPPHWIFIAEATNATLSPSLRLGSGELMDHWKDINLVAAAVAETNATPQWKWQSRQMVALRGGLHHNATNFAQGAAMMTIGTPARPSVTRWLVGQTNVGTIGRAGGFRILTTGNFENWSGAGNEPSTFYFDGVVYSI